MIAGSAKALSMWRRAVDRRRARSADRAPGLTGAALEKAIGLLALAHPDIVSFQAA